MRRVTATATRLRSRPATTARTAARGRPVICSTVPQYLRLVAASRRSGRPGSCPKRIFLAGGRRTPTPTPPLMGSDTPQRRHKRLARRHAPPPACRRPAADTRSLTHPSCHSLTRLNPRAASRTRRKKGDGGRFARGSHPASATRHAPRATPVAKPLRGCVLEPKRPRLRAWCRKFERPMHRRRENPVTKRDFGRSRWRDPDSNRGHHDFQSSGLSWPEARNPRKTSGSPAT